MAAWFRAGATVSLRSGTPPAAGCATSSRSASLPLRAAFTQDGKRIFASDFQGRVAVWTSADGKKAGELDANPVERNEDKMVKNGEGQSE